MIFSLGVALQLAAGAQAVPVLTRADPTAGAQARTELRVVAPVFYTHGALAGGHLALHAMVDLEGLTMPAGELATGGWGEGFSDRRHPHTWLHEFMLSSQARLPASVSVSLSAGKGFAPYGTEDPMSRPAIVYPVNHHWSQVLERAVVIAGVRAGPVTLEGGVFNGDEPMGWNKWPNWDRFGDSWSARGFLRPRRGVELEVSRAFLKSPEHRYDAGLDHTLWNASVAVSGRRPAVGDWRALAEWSHADEEGAYQYSALLAEAELKRGASRAYLRLERTERPEELRNFGDPFRSPRPHNENSNLGTTRWTTFTAGGGKQVAEWKGIAAEGVVEIARINVTRVTGVVFDPALFYGRNNLWMFSVAVRITAGTSMHRMGRYGVAAVEPVSMEHMHH